jgi:hypothetical protein
LGYSLLSGTARYYIRHDCGRYLFFWISMLRI